MKRIFLLLAAFALTTGCDDIFEPNLTNRTVTVIAPAEGAEMTEGTVTFLWEPASGARGYRLTIVAPDFDNATTVVADTLLMNDSLTVRRSFRCALTGGSYQWSISAFNSAYATATSVFDLKIVRSEKLEVSSY